MSSRLLAGLAAVGFVLAAVSIAGAHCQIPCGIYGDPVRFAQLKEHVTTIEKSMQQIQALSREKEPNWNQLVRWVGNKEAHADELAEIVTYYFMSQRVKPADPADAAASAKYVRQITLLHKMLVHAMKAKQTTDLEHCKQLRVLIHEFEASYLGQQVHKHAAAGHTHK